MSDSKEMKKNLTVHKNVAFYNIIKSQITIAFDKYVYPYGIGNFLNKQQQIQLKSENLNIQTFIELTIIIKNSITPNNHLSINVKVLLQYFINCYNIYRSSQKIYQVETNEKVQISLLLATFFLDQNMNNEIKVFNTSKLFAIYNQAISNKNNKPFYITMKKIMVLFAANTYKSYGLNIFYLLYTNNYDNELKDIGYYLFKIIFYNSCHKFLGNKPDLFTLNSNTKTQYDEFMKFYNQQKTSKDYNIIHNLTEYYDIIQKAYNLIDSTKTLKDILIIEQKNGFPVIPYFIIDNNDQNWFSFSKVVNRKIKDYPFTFTQLYTRYYVKFGNTTENKLNDLVVYKSMPNTISYEDFKNFRDPSWFTVYTESLLYNTNNVTYAFKFYPPVINLFTINVENLISLKKLAGNSPVWMFGLKPEKWELMAHQAANCDHGKGVKGWRKNQDNKGTFTLNMIIDHAFFYGLQTFTRINRNSNVHIDYVFTKGLCTILNTQINFYTRDVNNDINTSVADKHRIYGYIADALPDYKGIQMFHKEMAICNPEIIMTRKTQNRHDFGKKLPNNWCYNDGTSTKLKCIDFSDYYYPYQNNFIKLYNLIENHFIEGTERELEREFLNKNSSQIHHIYKDSGNLTKAKIREMSIIQIETYKSYYVNLEFFNSLSKCINCNNEDLIKFFKSFMKRLFNYVSDSPYKLHLQYIRAEQIGKYAWRANHGSVHHMRTLSIALQMMQILVNKGENIPNPIKKLIDTQNKRLAIVIASVFVSLCRIDESTITYRVKLRLPLDRLIKIFPNIGKYYPTILKEISENCVFTLLQLSACFMYLSMISNLLNIEKIDCEIFALSTITYNNFSGTEFLKRVTADEKSHLKNFNIICGFILLPHYIDHCRGAFSQNMYKVFLYYSLYMLNFDENDIATIMLYAIKNLLLTHERDKWDGKSVNQIKLKDVRSKCVYSKNEFITMAINESKEHEFSKSQHCCTLLSKRGSNANRYSVEFVELSSNFEECWRILKIKNDMKNCFISKIKNVPKMDDDPKMDDSKMDDD